MYCHDRKGCLLIQKLIALKPSKREALAMLLFFVSGAAIGWAVWLSDMPTALLLALIPLWGMTKNRAEAFCLWFAYYLFGSSVLPAASAVFFGEEAWLILGYVMWLSSAVLLAMPWTLVTFTPTWKRALGLPLAWLMVALPPLGIIGWLNPLTSAGWLMPGMGWSGIALWFAVGMCLIVVFGMAGKKSPSVTAAMFLLLCVVLIQMPKPQHWEVEGWPSSVYGWTALSTHLGKMPSDYDSFITRQIQVIALVKKELAKPETRVVVLPEQIVGSWTKEMTEPIWMSLMPLQSMKEQNQTVLFGGSIANGSQYDNALIAFTGDGIGVTHLSVQPVPVSMWNPFSNKDAIANWSRTNRGELRSILYTVSLCYEDLLVWPILHGFAVPRHERPFTIISVANQWWVKGSGEERIQQKSIEAWAMLFTANLVRSTND